MREESVLEHSRTSLPVLRPNPISQEKTFGSALIRVSVGATFSPLIRVPGMESGASGHLSEIL